MAFGTDGKPTTPKELLQDLIVASREKYGFECDSEIWDGIENCRDAKVTEMIIGDRIFRVLVSEVEA